MKVARSLSSDSYIPYILYACQNNTSSKPHTNTIPYLTCRTRQGSESDELLIINSVSHFSIRVITAIPTTNIMTAISW